MSRQTYLPDEHTARLRGIWFFKPRGLWAAEIRVRGERLKLGYFADPVSAAEAYDVEAAKCGRPLNRGWPWWGAFVAKVRGDASK